MRTTGSATRIAVCAVVVGLGLAVSAAAQQAAPTVVPVGTMAAAHKPITKTIDFVGRVQSVNRVEVRARVTGYLEDVLFTEGDVVKEGQPLYHIEKDQFQAAVDQAQGVLQGSQAKKLLTAIQYQRAEDLMKTNAGTVVARDQALTADRAEDAQILIDQASLETAKINLGYTDITSPITGKIGRTNITKGNVVSPDSGALTKIVSQDPMYVLFPVSERDILRAREAGACRRYHRDQGQPALRRQHHLQRHRKDRFCRCDGRQVDRHGAGACRLPQQVRRADRPAAGPRHP